MSAVQDSDFFIGWQDQAPPAPGRYIRRLVWLLLLGIPLAAALLVMNQTGFTSSTFELGRLSILEGQLLDQPVPMLRVTLGQTYSGEPLYQDVLLVSFGKIGAQHTIREWESLHRRSAVGRQVKLEGTLIYYDGKTVFELSRKTDSFLEVGEEVLPAATAPEPLGYLPIVGEIVDPKCWFGVMRPGFGKPHRSCAARCLLGGIPAVLRAESTSGQSSYYLLLGPQGRPVNEALLPYIGEKALFCGKLERHGDWLALRLNPRLDISALPSSFRNGDIPMCAE